MGDLQQPNELAEVPTTTTYGYQGPMNLTNPHDSLPALPSPSLTRYESNYPNDYYTPDQMRAYALQALAQRGEVAYLPDATHWLDDDTGEVIPADSNPNNPPDGYTALCPRATSAAPPVSDLPL